MKTGEKLAESLRLFLERGKEWERRPTSAAGIFILKLPAFKGSPPRLCVEINPVDPSGSPTKKRGLIIRNAAELNEFKELITQERLEGLVGELERINPVSKPAPKKEVEVIEI